MMGDEEYTNAFASRFDLAGSNIKTFEGSLFEPNGIDLSGGAGFELYSLYKATQYYQKALDRFYTISPVVWKSIKNGGSANSLTQKLLNMQQIEVQGKFNEALKVNKDAKIFLTPGGSTPNIWVDSKSNKQSTMISQ